MSSDQEKQEITDWLAEQGCSPKEVERVFRKLERFDNRAIYESLFGTADNPEIDLGQVAHEVRAEMRDDNKRELLRWLIVDQKLPPNEIVEVMRRLEDHDMQGAFESLWDAEPDAEEDVAGLYQSTVDDVLREFRQPDAASPLCMSAYLPLLQPEVPGCKEAREETVAVVRQLAGLSRQFTCRGGPGTELEVAIEVLPAGAERPRALDRVPGPAPGRLAGVLQAAVPMSGLGSSDELPEPSPEQRLALGLRRSLQELMVAVNIAAPGALESGEGVVVGPAFELRIEALTSCLPAAVQHCRQLGWPKVETLPLADVYRWLRTEGGLLLDSVGESALARALNSLSHLFVPPEASQAFGLFYAALGLDVLFTDGTEGSLRQLVEKSRLLLGDNRRHQELIQQAYVYRARLARGKLAFPGKFAGLAAVKGGPDADESYRNAFHLSAGVLVTTLQRMAKHGWHELRFSYSVMPPNDGATPA